MAPIIKVIIIWCVLTQTTGDWTSEIAEHPPDVIRLISKMEMKDELVPPIPVHRYNGPKKPDMPEECCKCKVPQLRILASQVVSLSRAHDFDHLFLREVIENPSRRPEYNVFNVRLAQNRGQSAKPATT